DVTCAALPLAFTALEQSFAVCPTPPQKRHKLLANRRDRSAGASFPSWPSFSPKSVFFRSGFWDADQLLLELGFCFCSYCCCCCCYYCYSTSWRLGFAVCRSSCLKADFRVPVGFLLPVPNTDHLSTEPVPLAREVWRVYQS